MKYAERLAQIVFVGLLLIAAGLTYAGVEYHTVSLWAGAMAAYAQAVLTALVWWGLRLARQQQEFAQLGGPGAVAIPVAVESRLQGLSAADDNPAFAGLAKRDDKEVRTLETGFQRVVVVLAALGLVVIAAVITWMIVANLQAVKPGESIAVSPIDLDNAGLAAAIGALLGYFVLFSITRITARTQGYGEAVHGIVTMGLPGAIAVAVAVVLGYFKYGYVGEAGAGVVAFFLMLQAVELFFNAFRNYEGIEEFDQEAVDLQALPLVPMFTSQWILGLRILLGQSVGLSKERAGQVGVFARVMPRVIVAGLVVLIGVSMLREVPQGTVAIREHLGYASDSDINNPLQPGLHVLYPWPIDKLVVIPTQQLQEITVGAEEMVPMVNGQRFDFALWTTQHTEGGQEMEYETGDRLLLGGYVGVWWRVRNPSDFYRHISHSDFYGADKSDEQNQGRPIYESLIQENATYAVIHAFATHALEDIMAAGRGEVQAQCKKYLQDRLDAINSGIDIVDLTIKDVHPPQGVNETNTANGIVMGPAMAYEDVVRAREYREAKIDDGNASLIGSTNTVKGQAAAVVNNATADAIEQVNKARGDTGFFSTVGHNLNGHEDIAEFWHWYQTMEEVLPEINKIFVGENVKPPQVIQGGSGSASGTVVPIRTPG